MRSKAQMGLNSTVVGLVIALLLIGVGAYLTYKYVLGPGNEAGNQATCLARGGTCRPEGNQPGESCFLRMFGCPDDEAENNVYCCLPE